ncbi:MAG: hypothetical protein WD097_09220 [Balneolales bacterium]
MKNYIITAFILVFALCTVKSADAQMLPSNGDRTFEITVSPFSSSPVSFSHLRIRTFNSQNTAMRMRAGLNYLNESQNEDNSNSRLSILLAPGMEWHPIQEGRLSIYYGVEVPISYVTTRENVDGVKNVNNDGGEHFGLGLNSLLGFDIHFLERLYTGVEISYGLRYRSFLDAELNGNEIENNGSDISFSNSAISQFRLGFTF